MYCNQTSFSHNILIFIRYKKNNCYANKWQIWLLCPGFSFVVYCSQRHSLMMRGGYQRSHPGNQPSLFSKTQSLTVFLATHMFNTDLILLSVCVLDVSGFREQNLCTPMDRYNGSTGSMVWQVHRSSPLNFPGQFKGHGQNNKPLMNRLKAYLFSRLHDIFVYRFLLTFRQ